ncbi:MAG: OsmC family protein [Balneolaceae bacterium]
MDTVHNYEVDLKWQSDRKGLLSSPVLNEQIEIATPPEFPKGMEGIWSPEHFFVASVSSCLMTTFLAISEYSKLEYLSLDIKAVGKLEKVDGKFMISEITLKPTLTILDEAQTAKAERILHKSENACLISNSIKSTIIMDAEVIVSEKSIV